MSRYMIPKKFTGENRYFKIFTKKSMIYTGIGSSIGLFFFYIFLELEHPLIAILALFVWAMPFYIFGTQVYSKDNPYNGGEDMDVVWYRRLKKWRNKVIYVTMDRTERGEV